MPSPEPSPDRPTSSAPRARLDAARLVLPPRSLVGMIHLGALPGSPRATQSVDAIVAQAAAEAKLLARAGFDALMIENMHDAPYVNAPQTPEIVSVMTRAALAVRDAAPKLPLGVQVLSLGAKEALAIALASGGSFIRCENFVFAHVADEGLMPDAQAGPLLRYRRAIGAEHIAVLADIQKKHASHAITGDTPIDELARAAEFFGADGVIVTGVATGREASPDDVRRVRDATRLPVLVGSGVTPDNAHTLLEHADAMIVGSWYKRAGRWDNPPDEARARALVAAVRAARAGRKRAPGVRATRAATPSSRRRPRTRPT
jgi:membrane complex biogenesis BtpA family protein